MPGTQLLGLQRILYAIAEALLNPFALVPDHGDNPIGPGLLQSVDYISHHRPPTNRMQHLNQIRFHARAQTGCQYDSYHTRHPITS